MSTVVFNHPNAVQELVQPFLDSFQTVMRTMMSANSEASTPQLVAQGAHLYGISSVIGLSGDLTGAVTFSTELPTACKFLERMTGMESTEADEFVRDAMGELANMIAGHGKRELESYGLKLGLPQVILGDGMVLFSPRWAMHYWIHIQTELGPCTLDVGFSNKPM